MCSCEARDLFTLSSVCEETRSIFTSKSFWKARFTLLNIQHEEPSLSVYVHCLKLEKTFLGTEKPTFLFYREINLDLFKEMGKDMLEEYNKINQAIKNFTLEKNRVTKTGRLARYTYCLNELQSLLSQYLVMEKRQDRYTIFKYKEDYSNIGNEISRVPLWDLNKIQAVNLLLRLYTGR
nr:hypothetical protein Clen_403 [Cedratvirus lena]